MKQDKPKVKPIIIKAGDIMSFEFSNLMQKLINSPTSNKNASFIHKVYKEIERNAEEIRLEFKEKIIEVFAKRDANNKVIIDGNGVYQPIEEKLEEYSKAMLDFEQKEIGIEWRPLTPDALSDIKMTAKEIDLLGPLYSEQNGPGVPHLQGLPNA